MDSTAFAVFSLDETPLAIPHVVHDLAGSGSVEWRLRLEELGFLPGERVVVLRRGVGRDPLAVRVGHTTFALRRAEAACVRVRPCLAPDLQ